ncbi:MAG: YbaN family protein [Pseudomonadota bacterium]
MTPKQKFSPRRLFWLCLGCVCVGLGAVGVFVPLMPTTIFMIIAAYAFARSSSRLHDWLLSHAIFGPLIRDWNDHGVVSVKAKWMSGLSMGLILIISFILKMPLWGIAIQGLVLGAVFLFLLSRPSLPEA